MSFIKITDTTIQEIMSIVSEAFEYMSQDITVTEIMTIGNFNAEEYMSQIITVEDSI